MCVLWSDNFSFAADAISVSHARRFVRGRLESHNLRYLMDDIELVVSELATNAMVHAQTPFDVTLHAFERTVLLEVHDGSPSSPFRVAGRALDTGGRGIAIVEELSRDWGVDAGTDGGKSVWAEFARW